MNPWKDRPCGGSREAAAAGAPPDSPRSICPGYPECAKEERRCLNEVRAMGRGVPLGFKLSNGLKATEFCLQYIMKNHFKRKQSQSRQAVSEP